MGEVGGEGERERNFFFCIFLFWFAGILPKKVRYTMGLGRYFGGKVGLRLA